MQTGGPMAVVEPLRQNSGAMTSPDGGNTAVSRLQLMQARFQQKQQEEKEQKLLALYADRAQQAYARINNGAGGGKVRQLFQERRGLDRSYPLQPLEGRRGTSLDRGQQLRQVVNKKTNLQARGAPPRYPSAGYEGDDDYYCQPHPPPIFSSQQALDQDYITDKSPPPQPIKQQIFADENDYFSKSYDLDSTKIFKKLPNIGGTTVAEQKAMMAPAKEHDSVKKPTMANQIKSTTRNSSDSKVKTVTKAMAKLTPPSKKAEGKSVQNSDSKPKVGARRPTPVPVTNSVVSRPASASSTEKVKTTSMGTRVPSNAKTPPRSVVRPPLGANTGSQSDLVLCNICGRSFAKDRIAAHENICNKTSQRKRKPFDPVKQRLMGTGAEKYLRKGKPAPPPTMMKQSNWRRKHEEFISNIRAAKQAQAHVAAGGKLTDLPPPPPMDTSDYTQCPHCGRKFNDAAAARHIPKCATMLHNKPKPTPASNSRTQAAKKRY